MQKQATITSKGQISVPREFDGYLEFEVETNCCSRAMTKYE
jgi:hypothetical protein